VTRTVDSCESELAVFTGLNIAANLTVHEVLVPGVLNLPVFILNPGLSAVSADHHISISWILEDSVLVLQVSVNLNWSRGVRCVVDVTLAEIPSLDAHWDIELCSNSSIVKVRQDRLGIDAGGNFTKTLLQEGCIVSSCVDILWFKVSENRLRLRIWVASTKCIVWINVCHCLVELVNKSLADGWKSVVEERAIVSLPPEVGLWRQDTIPETHIKHLISIIEIVVSTSISHHKALKFRNESATLVLSAVSNVPIDSFNKTRNVYSSIWFSRDINVSVLKFWELSHNGKECLEVIIRRVEVSPNAFFLVTTDRESNTSRTFDVNYVCFFIPWIRVRNEVFFSIRKLIRTMFLKEPKHGWASRAAIEPDNYWISCLILLAECSNVMQAFWSSWNCSITWVESPRDVCPLPQLIDFISSWICRDCSHSR